MRFLFSIFLTMLILYSCKKNSNQASATTDNYDPAAESLSAEDNDYLSSLPNLNIHASDLYLLQNIRLDSFLFQADTPFYNKWISKINGKDNSEADADYVQLKMKLVGKLLAVAAYLSDRSNFKLKRGGSDYPEQYGLAYSLRSKDTIRKIPPDGTCNKNLKISGLDCSGFIYQLFLNSGFRIVSGTANEQRNPKALENTLHANSLYSDFEVEVIQQPKSEDLEEGDIIYFLRNDGTVRHIGIIGMRIFVLKDPIVVIQSHGLSDPTPKEDCLANLTEKKGVRAVSFNQQIMWPGFQNYAVLRISYPDKIVGTWKVRKYTTDKNGDGLINEWEKLEGSIVNDDYITFIDDGSGTYEDPNKNSIGNGSFSWNRKGGKFSYMSKAKGTYNGIPNMEISDYLKYSKITKYSKNEFFFSSRWSYLLDSQIILYGNPDQVVELYK